MTILDRCKTAERRSICQRCNSGVMWAHGRTPGGRQRLLCSKCGSSTCEGMALACSPLYGMRTRLSVCVEVIRSLSDGMTIGQVSVTNNLAKLTVRRIIERSGFVRRCSSCGDPIPKGNRWLFCSDLCQGTGGVFSATANVLRSLAVSGSHGHEQLAFSIAEEFSEQNAAEYLGPCYEAVVLACQRGITDQREVRKIARAHVKQMWRETKTHGLSLDQRKERWGWEASRGIWKQP